MALEEMRRCDVCHKGGAEPYRLSVSKVTGTGDSSTSLDEEKDYCLKCYDRLANFIQRGLNPPSGKKKEAVAS